MSYKFNPFTKKLDNVGGTSSIIDDDGNITLPSESQIVLTANRNPDDGTISKLIKFQMTDQYDRPWIAWYDENDRLRSALGYHSVNFSDSSNHHRFEIKTSDDPTGPQPANMKTSFYLSTDSTTTDASFNWLNRLYLDQNLYTANKQFGIAWRTPSSGGGTSATVGHALTSLDASDNTIFALDPMVVSGAKNATLRFFRSTNTSGTKRLVVYLGNDTTTEVLSLNAGTGIMALAGTLSITGNDEPTLNLVASDITDSDALHLRAHTDEYGTALVFWKHPTSTASTDRLAQITGHGNATGSLVDEMAFYTTDTGGTMQNRFKVLANITNTPLILTGGTGIARSSGNTITMGEDFDGGGTSAVNFMSHIRGASYLRVGSISIPNNTTAGDITALRINLGNTAFSANGRFIKDTESVMTATSGTEYYALFQPQITPASNSSATIRTLGFDAIWNPATGVTQSTLMGGFFQWRVRGDGLVDTIRGINTSGAVIDSSSAATTQVTDAVGIASQIYSRPSGTSTIAVATGVAFEALAITSSGATLTTAIGFRVRNATGSTITTQIGVDVEALTRGTTDIGIRVGKADTYSIQLSDTGGTAAGGITFGTDVTLYRSAADTLKTDDKLIVGTEANIVGDLNHDGTNIGFFGVAPTTRQTELTDELTTITFTAPGTPDYAIQDLTNAGGFGFVTKDEGNTVLSVVANLQARVNELETKLTAYGLLQDAD